jgi:hypothetical protein
LYIDRVSIKIGCRINDFRVQVPVQELDFVIEEINIPVA